MLNGLSETGAGLLWNALKFAAVRHRDQRRKGSSAPPYINHPIDLVHILWHEGQVRDTAVLAAALLHDTVEDTETSIDEIEAQFGPEIAGIVAEVTDDKSLPKAERKRLQVERAAYKSPKARLVKLADKISNTREILSDPPQDWSPERRRDYFTWAKAVIDPIRGTNAALENAFDEVLIRAGIAAQS